MTGIIFYVFIEKEKLLYYKDYLQCFFYKLWQTKWLWPFWSRSWV